MATAVESPGIVSAKEEAAAILFARQPQISPVIPSPTPEQPNQVTQTQSKYPSFASYHDPEPMPSRPQKIKVDHLQPYQVYDEVEVTTEPQVIRPYIDSSNYLSSAVAATSITTPEVTPSPEITSQPAKTAVTVIKSPLDVELEEDTQYVVKFKTSTIVAATIVATIFLLMSILCVVNIVNLVTMAGEISALQSESSALQQTLTEEKNHVEEARQNAIANGSNANYEVHYVPKTEHTYTAPTDSTTNSSFFDWLCHALSQLFG